MKEGWEYKKFKDISYSISDGDWIESKDQSCSGIRLIQTGNIGIGKFIPKDDSRKFITEDTFKRLRCSEIFEGDVLISRLPNPLGRSCILPNLDTRCITAVDCSIVRIKKDVVIPDYFIYYTQSQGYFSKIDSESSGTTRARITRKKLEQTEIPVPPLSEQQSIVDYLDSAFAKIDTMKANAEKALNEAKALFQASLKEMLEPKEGWEEKNVGKIAEIKGGKRLPKGEKLLSEPTSHKYIRVADFNEYGTVELSDIQYISDKVYEQIKRYIINKEDIYISIAGTIGKSGIIPEELDGANLTENACRLILSKEINQKFMYYMTISPNFIRQEIESTKISAQPKLALTRLAEILIAYPSIAEQKNIATTLDSLKAKVDKLQENYNKISQECDALKQAILRQVFE